MTQAQTDAVSDRFGAGRLGLITRLLCDALATLNVPRDGSAVLTLPLVLDCGGGSGAFAVPLAGVGCDVTVVDVSADALATLRRRADEAGVSSRVHAVNGDVEALPDLFDPARFDMVLAHGVLDVVERIDETFAGIAAAVRPGGLLSVLVANPIASVMARALGGEPVAALRELHDLDAGPEPFGPDAVERLCTTAGLTVEARHGIGVFSDLVPGAALDAPGARDALRELDAHAADRPPFSQIAGRIHLLARRPAG